MCEHKNNPNIIQEEKCIEALSLVIKSLSTFVTRDISGIPNTRDTLDTQDVQQAIIAKLYEMDDDVKSKTYIDRLKEKL